jgi:membrane protease YdiL (CAAX protease family)
MKPREILFGPDDKLRSGWRAAIFVAAFLFIVIALGTIVFAVVSVSGFDEQNGGGTLMLVNSAVPLLGALFVGWFCGKYLEALPFRALGAWFTSGWFKNLILGLVIGAITISFAIGIASLFGNLDFSFNSADAASILRTLAVSLVIFAVAAAFEEALFRGYILQTFARSGLAWFAILLTSVFFGAVHLSNPNAGYLSSVNTALAGIWFGVAYLKTRDLWLVWGMHLMWNWMQGSFYGVEVSGLTEFLRFPVLKETDGGPAWLTGENYGIEASVACTIALLASTVAIHFLPTLEPSEEMKTLTSP